MQTFAVVLGDVRALVVTAVEGDREQRDRTEAIGVGQVRDEAGCRPGAERVRMRSGGQLGWIWGIETWAEDRS